MPTLLAPFETESPETQAGWRFDVSSDDRVALDEWQALDERLQNPHLSCSFDWVATWIEVYGRHLPHRYLMARCDGEIVGMALLVDGCHREGPFTVRTLHLGTAGEPTADSAVVEFNRPLVATGHGSEFFREICRRVEQDPRWDRLQFDGLAGDVAEELLNMKPGAAVRRVPSFYFDLDLARQNQQDVLDLLGSSTRRNVRQNLKHFGDVTLDWGDTVPLAEEIFDDLVRLHQLRWTTTGEPGCYSSELFTRFHRQLIQRLVPRGKLVCTRIRNASEVLGCVQLFVERNRLLFYQCGSVRLDAKLSPGLITDYMSMQAGLDRGFDAYDFLAGDTVHKRKLSTHSREVVWAAWERPRLKLKTIELLRFLKHRLRTALSRKIPQSAPAPDVSA